METIAFSIFLESYHLRIILLLLLASSYCAEAQDSAASKKTFTSRDSLDYVRKAISFIEQVNKQQLSDSNYRLVDEPFSAMYNDCLDKFLVMPGLFSPDEIRIAAQREYPAASRWRDGWFKQLKVISRDTVSSIFETKAKGWDYFLKAVGRGYRNFSMPIFLRNDSLCIFYSDVYCGDRCEDGNIHLYKKEDGIWIQIPSPCITWEA